MSFTIVLQNNSSPVNKIGKSLTDITSMTGTFKNEADIINPVILIYASSSDIKRANYLTISDLGRKYFITEVVSVRSYIWEVHTHVDVLETYKNQIKAHNAVVLRQENNFNLLLNDGVFKCKQNPRISYKQFPSGLGAFNYILITAGGAE